MHPKCLISFKYNRILKSCFKIQLQVTMVSYHIILFINDNHKNTSSFNFQSYYFFSFRLVNQLRDNSNFCTKHCLSLKSLGLIFSPPSLSPFPQRLCLTPPSNLAFLLHCTSAPLFSISLKFFYAAAELFVLDRNTQIVFSLLSDSYLSFL